MMNTQGFQCSKCLIRYKDQIGNFYRQEKGFKTICIDCEKLRQKAYYHEKNPNQTSYGEGWNLNQNEDISDELAAKYMEAAKNINDNMTFIAKTKHYK